MCLAASPAYHSLLFQEFYTQLTEIIASPAPDSMKSRSVARLITAKVQHLLQLLALTDGQRGHGLSCWVSCANLLALAWPCKLCCQVLLHTVNTAGRLNVPADCKCCHRVRFEMPWSTWVQSTLRCCKWVWKMALKCMPGLLPQLT